MTEETLDTAPPRRSGRMVVWMVIVPVVVVLLAAAGATWARRRMHLAYVGRLIVGPNPEAGFKILREKYLRAGMPQSEAVEIFRQAGMQVLARSPRSKPHTSLPPTGLATARPISPPKNWQGFYFQVWITFQDSRFKSLGLCY